MPASQDAQKRNFDHSGVARAGARHSENMGQLSIQKAPLKGHISMEINEIARFAYTQSYIDRGRTNGVSGAGANLWNWRPCRRRGAMLGCIRLKSISEQHTKPDKNSACREDQF